MYIARLLKRVFLYLKFKKGGLHVISLAKNELEKELLKDLEATGGTKKLNCYIWTKGQQKYRVKFAVRTMKNLAKKLQESGYHVSYVTGGNGSEVTARIIKEL